ncbi:CHAP domain-containing protein [Sphingorhabdus sp. SMR4y]|uniref:CHAP domain-containing protein n=1 Tax=Sphingorhabdus sp. SMR4y TaxID=2584094 RepID=UPI000B5C369D|nr:CHAP domain-containing protein [Sphingorhabdus sp. SMR4y]ASK88225.1 CHAP domain protein [Sphingorhabdus sp. SMR4y]
MNGPALRDILITIRNAIIPILLALQALMMPVPAHANDYLQCVPFARELSGIRIYGDAHSWWDQAEGAYQRGTMPAEGAVLSLPSHGSMRLGHVAVVREIVDDRTILISHANWSPINGRRGQIERRVAARDVSEANDWSKVRIWYAPIGKLGTTAFPVNGFIYPEKPNRQSERQWASSQSGSQSRRQNRQLLDRGLKAELAQTANRERPTDGTPRDLIGELLDRVGS